MNHLPKLHPSVSPTPKGHGIHFAPVLSEAARLEVEVVLVNAKSSLNGLSGIEASRRLAEVGPNVVAVDKRHGWLRRLLTAARNPLVILLVVLAAVS
ncbi:MAG: cation-transporting P-type ATPase, partial [Verrucomicrobiales bacterium]